MSHIDQVYLITSIESFQMTMELESVKIGPKNSGLSEGHQIKCKCLYLDMIIQWPATFPIDTCNTWRVHPPH